MRSESNNLWRAVLLCLLATGAVLTANGVTAQPPAPNDPDYRLGAGDDISIQVYETPELSIEKTRISGSGDIDYPVLGEVEVAGMSPSEASDRIASRLKSENILRDPQVTVSVETYRSRSVTIVGEVGEPGEYYLSEQRTLVDVLAKAGWVGPEGADYILLTRQTGDGGEQQRLSLDALTSGQHQGMQARAGDRVVVPKQEMFYIQGAINSAGAYRLNNDMTVMEAVSIGGGLTPRGSRSRIKIKRRNDAGEVKTYDASMDDRLQPGDTVLVKERLF